MVPRIFTAAVGLILSTAAVPAQSNNMLEGSKPQAPPTVEAPKPQLTPEHRGDIYMARKMYREAIDAFREGPPKDPVLWNKMGIGYHPKMALDLARKSYEQALKFRRDYVEAINNLGTVYYAKKSFRK